MPSNFILQDRAYKAIDAAAGEVRRRYITDISGQEAVYLEKRTEAALFIAAWGTNPGTAVPGPHVAAESAATGKSPIVVANEIIAAATTWLTTLSPAIEAKRIAGKERVRAATVADDIVAEQDAAVAEILALFLPTGP